MINPLTPSCMATKSVVSLSAWTRWGLNLLSRERNTHSRISLSEQRKILVHAYIMKHYTVHVHVHVNYVVLKLLHLQSALCIERQYPSLNRFFSDYCTAFTGHSTVTVPQVIPPWPATCLPLVREKPCDHNYHSPVVSDADSDSELITHQHTLCLWASHQEFAETISYYVVMARHTHFSPPHPKTSPCFHMLSVL